MKHAREDYNRIQDPSGKIPEDEPVFLLRGQDILTPTILLKYAHDLIDIGADQKIIDTTLGHVKAIREWQAEHGSKIPDLPTLTTEE